LDSKMETTVAPARRREEWRIFAAAAASVRRVKTFL
jgi:hypothetical protein